MARAPRADGSKFARDTAADLARPLPKPICPLDKASRKFWPLVLKSKRLSAWTKPDLLLAAQLCRDFAQVELLGDKLAQSASLYKDAKGVIREHPAVKLIEKLNARIVRTMRALQIHSAAVNGLTHHQPGKNTKYREMAGQFEELEDDDLFASPEQFE